MPNRYPGRPNKGPQKYAHRYILLTTGANNMIKQWSFQNFELTKQIRRYHNMMIEGMELFNYKLKGGNSGSASSQAKRSNQIALPNRKFFVVTYSNEVAIWNMEEGRIVRRYRHCSRIISLVSLDASLEEDTHADVLDFKNSQKNKKIGYYLAFNDSYYTNILNLNTMRCVRRFKNPDESTQFKKLESIWVNQENKNERSHRLVSIGSDKNMRIWNWRTGHLDKSIPCGIQFDGKSMALHHVYGSQKVSQMVLATGRRGKKVVQIYDR